MADWVALFAIAAALYFIECLAWIEGPATACFAPVLRSSWICARGEDLPGNERGGLALLNPLRLTGSLVASSPWPFAMSPEGLSSFGSHPWTLAGAAPRALPFAEIQTVEASFGRILINGAPFVRVGSVMFAADLACQIRELSRQTATERTAAIESAMRTALDETRVQETWSAFRRDTRRLATVATALLGYLFLFSPAVIFGIGPHPFWLYLLIGLFALALTVAIQFFRLHSRLCPGFTFERWTQAFSMFAVPISAIRAADKLSRERLRGFSVIAIAPTLCGADTATPLLRRIWFDLPSASQAADACTAWFLERLRKETKAALDRQKVPVLAPPDQEPAMTSYCPRCHTQFTTDARRECTECTGMQLAAFG